MYIFIAGGGRTGAQLAKLLVEQKHKVRLLENRREVLTRLHREIPTEVIYEGNPTDPHVLDQMELDQVDVLAACTSEDATNLAMCYMARTRYRVPRIIARINNPRNAWLFDEKFHIDVALNPAELLSSLIIEEMSMGDMMTLLKLRRGQYALVEEKVPPGAKAVGMAIKDLVLPEQCVIAAIIRHGKMVVPRGITTIEAGDEVLSVTDPTGAEQLRTLFASPAGNGQRKN